MRKRARSVLTGLLVLCCTCMGFMPKVHVRADSSDSVTRNIIVTENAGLTRTAYPVVVALAAESTTAADWHLADPSGAPIACSIQQTGTSALVLHFLADLPANSAQTFKLVNGTGSAVTGVTQLPLFMGTSYLVYVEKVLEVASFEAGNLVRLVQADGTLLLSRTLGPDESMSYTAKSPQVVRIDAAKPVSVWLVTMAPDSEQQALRQSNDDVYGTVGTDLLVRTFGELWLAAPSSTSVSLTSKGSTRTIALSPASVRFVDGLEPGIYRLRSSSPVCVTSGVEEDNISCVQYPVGTWFAGPSFGQTTITSWRPATTVTTSFAGTTQTSLLPELGSSTTRTTIAQNAYVAGKTEWKPIVVESNGPYTLTTDGNSGNFGLEQYPSTALTGSGLNFVVTSGKLFSGFSQGHFRRLAVVGVQDGADVTLSTGASSQRFTLNTAQAKILRIDASGVPIRLTSTKPVQLFDLGEEAREGLAVALPLADSSVNASVAEVSSSSPVASTNTDETTQTSTPVESPSSGPWQAVSAWIQKATRATGAFIASRWQTAWVWIQKATHATGTFIAARWQTAWVWIQKTTRATGAFVASLTVGIRDFFVSGKALKVLQTATQAINDLAVRLFLPLAALVVPVLGRMVSGLSVTPELVAVWMFWVVVVLALIILLLALRPRRNVGKRLPKVTPRTAGQKENTIEFGLVEQGPIPSPTMTLDRLTRTHEKQEAQRVQEPAAQPAIAEESSHARLESPQVSEISLEPLGFFAGTETAPAAVPHGAADAAAMIAPAVPAEVPSEALLMPPQEGPPAQELPSEMLLKPFPEPELRPIGQEAPAQPIELESSGAETALPLERPMPTEEFLGTQEALQAEKISVPEAPVAPQAASMEEPVSTQETGAPTHEEVSLAKEMAPATQETSELVTTPEVVPVEVEPLTSDRERPAAKPPESNPGAAPSADLLSRLLADEESFQQTVAAASAPAGVTASVPPVVPVPASRPALQPSIFSGAIELDTLLRDGVVTDAGALAQLFRGGYRNRISKLAVSAKDLQNVPEEIRHVIKLTVVALSPIELSIARDLAMRLEAPGFVGEALLVAKKMGYENYLTTYKNISKNYKDVSIVETASLKTPEISAESGNDLVSFS